MKTMQVLQEIELKRSTWMRVSNFTREWKLKFHHKEIDKLKTRSASATRKNKQVNKITTTKPR